MGYTRLAMKNGKLDELDELPWIFSELDELSIVVHEIMINLGFLGGTRGSAVDVFFFSESNGSKAARYFGGKIWWESVGMGSHFSDKAEWVKNLSGRSTVGKLVMGSIPNSQKISCSTGKTRLRWVSKPTNPRVHHFDDSAPTESTMVRPTSRRFFNPRNHYFMPLEFWDIPPIFGTNLDVLGQI